MLMLIETYHALVVCILNAVRFPNTGTKTAHRRRLIVAPNRLGPGSRENLELNTNSYPGPSVATLGRRVRPGM